METKRCSRCLLPSHYPSIAFDNEGVCSLCIEEANKPPIDWQKRRKDLDKIISDAKARKLPYDALVPWSGGKDSTYTIYILKKVYNCRILAFNFHNGFQSDDAARNISSISEHLGFDTVILRQDWSLLKRIYRLFLKKKGEICTVCNTVGYAVGLSFAARQSLAFGDSPLLIAGWSKILEAMPGADHFNYQIFSDIIDSEPGLLSEFESSPLIDKNICKMLRSSGDPRASLSSMLNRAFQLPDFWEWNPDKFTPIIEKEAGYSIASNGQENHFDCNITPVAVHLFEKEWGFDQSVTMLSTMIRNHFMTREEGLSRLCKQPCLSNEIKEYFYKRLGIMPEEINIAKRF